MIRKFKINMAQGKKMRITTKYYLLLTLVVMVYFVISKILFDKVNELIRIVIDELFHIPQGIMYCNHNFSTWNPKITTLPGLYLVTAGTVGFLFKCNTYNLRFLNLIASCVNLILFSSILKFIYGNRTDSQTKIILQALNLTILPPLYFFSHVYYTDTISLMFLLLFFRLCFVNKSRWLILITGLCSVLMRQTNIVWVAMVLGHKFFDIIIKSSRVHGNQFLTRNTLSKKSLITYDADSSKLKRYYELSDLLIAIKFHCNHGFRSIFKFITTQEWFIIIQQSFVLLTFAIFLIVNGGIVVGDKKAHEPQVHCPQLLYFLLFYGVFGLPYVLSKLVSTLKLMFSNKIDVLILSIVVTIFVHYNTVVHPYLLADNRHYVFYIWNRWFGKYEFAIYATIPVYIFLLFSLYDNLKDQNCISFLLPFVFCLFLALGLQKLVELRYFLVPYIILRLRFVRPTLKVVIGEFVLYLVLNVVTFYIFVNKEIAWSDFKEPQRIIW